MKSLKEELSRNFRSFGNELKGKYVETFTTLETNEGKYLESYERLSTLEAWRAYLLEYCISGSSLNFFLEAQNDALLAHTFARIGSWRTALQSLRSLIENTLFCLYYKDHPVELNLWENGKHQQSVSDYIAYIAKHPRFYSVNANITGVALLKKEYSTLSKAVHGSSRSFRMTKKEDDFPALMIPDITKLNQWLTREAKAIQIVNQVLITMFSEHLQAAKLRNLRKSVSFAIPTNLYTQIRDQFGIRLFKIPPENP
ncbi:MAG: hypothetical protein JRJ38_13115 [Deltaproteobacteria bacterium]|nr:hypothetical protein [Deltaproteobacteria bacterium]